MKFPRRVYAFESVSNGIKVGLENGRCISPLCECRPDGHKSHRQVDHNAVAIGPEQCGDHYNDTESQNC